MTWMHDDRLVRIESETDADGTWVTLFGEGGSLVCMPLTVLRQALFEHDTHNDDANVWRAKDNGGWRSSIELPEPEL